MYIFKAQNIGLPFGSKRGTGCDFRPLKCRQNFRVTSSKFLKNKTENKIKPIKNVKYQFYWQLNQAHNYHHKISGLDNS